MLVFGILLGMWAMVWDRSRGRLRCPKCWYSMSGTPASVLEQLAIKMDRVRCPECGKCIDHIRQLRKSRKSWWLFVLALLLVALSPQAFEQPQRITNGETWSRAVPTWFACCFLVSDDVNIRTDAKMLLTVRLPRCNFLERRWIYLWRDAGLPSDVKELLDYRKQVVAGMPFRVDGQSNMSWNMNVPRLGYSTRTLTLPMNAPSITSPAGFVSRVFATPITIADSIHPSDWTIVAENTKTVDAGRVWSSYLKFRAVAPQQPGKRTVQVPLESVVNGEIIRISVPIDVEVFSDLHDVLTPVEDKIFEAQVAKWMRLYISENGSVSAWYLGEERDFPFALNCEVVFQGKVVATANRPLVPFADRSVDLNTSVAVSQRLLRVKRKVEPVDGWTLRVSGSPEAIHELTTLSEYWKGNVEIPIADVLE